MPLVRVSNGGTPSEGEQTLIINAMTPGYNGNSSFSYSQQHTFTNTTVVVIYACYSRVNGTVPTWNIGPYSGSLTSAGAISKAYVLEPGTYTISMVHGTGPSGYFVKASIIAFYID